MIGLHGLLRLGEEEGDPDLRIAGGLEFVAVLDPRDQGGTPGRVSDQLLVALMYGGGRRARRLRRPVGGQGVAGGAEVVRHD